MDFMKHVDWVKRLGEEGWVLWDIDFISGKYNFAKRIGKRRKFRSIKMTKEEEEILIFLSKLIHEAGRGNFPQITTETPFVKDILKKFNMRIIF